MKLKGTLILTSLSTCLSILIVSCADQSPRTNKSELKSTSVVETGSEPSVSPSSAPTSSVAPVGKKIEPGEVTGVDMERVFRMQQTGKALLVDCRPPIIYRLGHLDGAINLPFSNYDSYIDRRKQNLDDAVTAHQTIVLYCQHTECPDAYAVAKKLIIRGYSVSIYKGGWEEWKRAGL